MNNADPFTPPQPLLRAVTFDLDGLMVNSEDVYEQVGTATLARRGKTFDADLREAMMGRPAGDALRVMIDWHQLDDTVDQLLAESETRFWEIAKEQLRPMPGLLELLAWLDRQALPYGVATSGGQAYAERILRSIGALDRLRFLITADDVENGKPAPDPYLLAADRHGVEPAEMLVLEDSGTGCRSAVAAGAYTVATPSDHTRGHDFPPVALTADSLADPRIRQALRSAELS